MKRGLFVWVTMLVLALLVLAACGGRDGPPEADIADYPQTSDPIENQNGGDMGTPIEPNFPRDLAYYDTHGQMSVDFVAHLSNNLYNRVPFSYREYEAARWIADTLIDMGHPATNVYIQTFDAEFGRNAVWGMNINALDGPTTVQRGYSQNVVLTIPGTGDGIIVVGAHYDTLYLPGASDNASGTALLLESAYRMLGGGNYHTLVYVFFGAEEIGLIGAYYFLENMPRHSPDDIVLMFNVDVILEGPYLFFSTGYSRFGEWNARLNDTSRRVMEIAGEINDDFDRDLRHIRDAHLSLMSDHIPFTDAGHTVVLLASTAAPRGNMQFNFPILHTPRDSFEYLYANYPDKMRENMRYAAIFLARVLRENFNQQESCK